MNHSFFCTCLGSIIKATRLRKKLSQYALAELAGVGRRYIQRIENGHQEATLSTFFILAQALETSPMLLIGELEYALQHGALSKALQEILPPKKLGRPKVINKC